jgi:putative hemolysin
VSEFDAGLGPALRIPKLFRIYLRLGAWVVSEPALDAEFGTIDFLILLDGESVTFSKLNTRPR